MRNAISEESTSIRTKRQGRFDIHDRITRQHAVFMASRSPFSTEYTRAAPRRLWWHLQI
jgi:hypothetical protein